MFTPVGRNRRWRRTLCLGLLIALAPLALYGCFGSFPLTSAVYNGNRNVYGSVEGDRTVRKLAQTGVMWIFIPVYVVAMAGDVVVFNLIEFWTGSQTNVGQNPEVDGPKIAVSPFRDGPVVSLTREGMLVIQTPPTSEDEALRKI